MNSPAIWGLHGSSSRLSKIRSWRKKLCGKRRIALAMHLYFMDLLDQSVAFAAKFPPQTDVFHLYEQRREENAD